MKKSKSFQKKTEKLRGDEQTGLLVAVFGATGEVEDGNGRIIRCHLRKNIEPVITGDYVYWQKETEDTGIIVGHLPRKSLLSRPEHNGKEKLIAANIDAIIIVTAPPPALSEYLIDRYLVAAETLKIPAVILLNKIDLLDEKSRADVMSRLAIYEKINYPLLFSSTYQEDGLSALDNFLTHKTCVLVGVSGVGKSSIIAAFSPDALIKIGETSSVGSGKHTTTVTRLYHLHDDNQLIDSPGVREFGLKHLTKEEILNGFVEFKSYLNDCKFRDCKHLKEPGCALGKAVLEGKISESRLKSFRELMGIGS